MKGLRRKLCEMQQTNPAGFANLLQSIQEHITHDKKGWTKLLADLNQKKRVSYSDVPT
jgi:hypothetical protein